MVDDTFFVVFHIYLVIVAVAYGARYDPLELLVKLYHEIEKDENCFSE